MANNQIQAIDSFKAKIQSIQRASLFDVTIPSIKYHTEEGKAEMLKFSVKAATFPGSTVGDLAVNYMGRVVHWYGDRQYGGTWATTCILDGKWEVFNALYAWNQGMGGANRVISADLNMHDNFKVDSYVTAYTTDGQVAHKVKLIGMWPQDLAEISMDWSSADTAVDLAVTWVYDYVISVDSTVDETKDQKDTIPNLEGASGTESGNK